MIVKHGEPEAILDIDSIVGFDEGEVDPSKGFDGSMVTSLGEWNKMAMNSALQQNQDDPFERKEQRVKYRTRAKLAYRNWNRKRKLGIDV